MKDGGREVREEGGEGLTEGEREVRKEEGGMGRGM